MREAASALHPQRNVKASGGGRGHGEEPEGRRLAGISEPAGFSRGEGGQLRFPFPATWSGPRVSGGGLLINVGKPPPKGTKGLFLCWRGRPTRGNGHLCVLDLLLSPALRLKWG